VEMRPLLKKRVLPAACQSARLSVLPTRIFSAVNALIRSFAVLRLTKQPCGRHPVVNFALTLELFEQRDLRAMPTMPALVKRAAA